MRTLIIVTGVVALCAGFCACGDDCEPDFDACQSVEYEMCQDWDDYNGDWRGCYIEARRVQPNELPQPSCDVVLAEVEACCGGVDAEMERFCESWWRPAPE